MTLVTVYHRIFLRCIFLFSDLRLDIVSACLILGPLITIFHTFRISTMPHVPTPSLSKFSYSKNI